MSHFFSVRCVSVIQDVRGLILILIASFIKSSIYTRISIYY